SRAPRRWRGGSGPPAHGKSGLRFRLRAAWQYISRYLWICQGSATTPAVGRADVRLTTENTERTETSCIRNLKLKLSLKFGSSVERIPDQTFLADQKPLDWASTFPRRVSSGGREGVVQLVADPGWRSAVE